MRKFNIVMCVAWLVITIMYAILAIDKVDVPAWSVIGPGLICIGYYFDKIFDRRDK